MFGGDQMTRFHEDLLGESLTDGSVMAADVDDDRSVEGMLLHDGDEDAGEDTERVEEGEDGKAAINVQESRNVRRFTI